MCTKVKTALLVLPEDKRKRKKKKTEVKKSNPKTNGTIVAFRLQRGNKPMKISIDSHKLKVGSHASYDWELMKKAVKCNPHLKTAQMRCRALPNESP